MNCRCGKLVKKGNRTCGAIECIRYRQGAGHRGKKRPDHAEKMKKYAREGKFDSWKNSSVDHLNTDDFKRKRLIKHGYSFTEDDINEQYNKLQSSLQKSPDSKRRQLLNFLKNKKFMYENEFIQSELNGLSEETVESLCDEEIIRLSKVKNSIKSIVSMKKNLNMGARSGSKREWITDLRFNTRVRSVYIRSSYEKNYIEYFEENRIPWDYEPFSINTEFGYYLPDFMFTFNGVTYLLEVKGYLSDYADYYERKLKYAIAYCANHNMIMLYSEEPEIVDIAQLIKKRIK